MDVKLGHVLAAETRGNRRTEAQSPGRLLGRPRRAACAVLPSDASAVRLLPIHARTSSPPVPRQRITATPARPGADESAKIVSFILCFYPCPCDRDTGGAARAIEHEALEIARNPARQEASKP